MTTKKERHQCFLWKCYFSKIS